MTEKYELDEMVEFIFYQGNTIVERVFNDCCVNCAIKERKYPGASFVAVACNLNGPPNDEFDIPGRCIRESNRLRWEAATGQKE